MRIFRKLWAFLSNHWVISIELVIVLLLAGYKYGEHQSNLILDNLEYYRGSYIDGTLLKTYRDYIDQFITIARSEIPENRNSVLVITYNREGMWFLRIEPKLNKGEEFDEKQYFEVHSVYNDPLIRITETINDKHSKHGFPFFAKRVIGILSFVFTSPYWYQIDIYPDF